MRYLSQTRAAFMLTAASFLLIPALAQAAGIDVYYPETVVQGGIYPITVSGEGIVSVTGTFGRGRVYLNPTGAPGVFSGLTGVHVAAPAGERPLVIVAITKNGDVESMVVPVTVEEGVFPTEFLSVEEKFVAYDDVTRERIREEGRQMKRVLRRETPRRLWSEPFVTPCAGPISGRFGLTRYFNGTRSFPHMGIDISANTGEPVVAANDGIVALILDSYMGGLTLLIDHGQGLYTAYCHLSAVLVREGDSVCRGRPVALVGATGRVTGAHLHFGVFLNHHIVNPDDLPDKPFR